jgi:hypothetical protein
MNLKYTNFSRRFFITILNFTLALEKQMKTEKIKEKTMKSYSTGMPPKNITILVTVIIN